MPSEPGEDLDLATGYGEPLPESRVVKRDRISLVWLLPVLALVVGGWLAYKTWSEKGPTVYITFKTASGLEAGKTKVKFKDVEIGRVTGIEVSKNLEQVVVTVELTAGSERYLTEKTTFWVARPRVTVSRISGLETLLSGAYVAIDPVLEGEPARRFVGLAEPPVITTDEPGTRYRLRSETLGSLNLGSPVYYRHIQVGQVINYELDKDGAAVTIEIFIAEREDRLVSTTTRFWNASGIDFKLGADGVSVDTESMLSVLLGGIAFDTPDTLDREGAPASPDQFFPLYANRDAAHERVYLNKERYLMVFGGSVRGLNVGAPVLVRGIEVGQVLDVQLRFDPDKLDFSIPVLIEIEPERISVEGGVERVRAEDPNILSKLVGGGLRGQLKTGSLITGQLYVDLDFYPDAPAAKVTHQNGYRVLPTVPAPLEAITTNLTSLMAKVNAFPLDKIGNDLTATLAGIRTIVDSPSLDKAVKDLERTLSLLQSLAGQLDNSIAPELTATLTETRAAVANVNGVIGPDAPISVEAVRTMREFTAAARSIRAFADYLDRHPEALIRGKGGGR